MRLFPAILLCATIGTGGAQASSLVALGEAEPAASSAAGGSIAFADEPASPPEGFVVVSSSIIAMEDYAPAATAEVATASEAAPASHDDAAGGGIVAFAADPAPPPEDFVAVSSSIIAMEDYAPPVANEKVAAIPQSETAAAPKRRFDPAPMVIRGGIVGDAFARSIPPAVSGEEGGEPEEGETPMAAAEPGMPEESDPQSPLLHARPPE